MRRAPRSCARMLLTCCLLLMCLGTVLPGPAAAQNPGLGEWGDAPEGVDAYPPLGVPGLFPTCYGGPSGFVWHGPVLMPDLYLGSSADFELDGNAGFCPPPPFEMDESWGAADGDGGLRLPTPFTIDPTGTYIQPNGGPSPAVPLGFVCQDVVLSSPNAPLVIDVHNTTGIPCYLNVVFDWNQNGQWGDLVQCPTGPVFYEHAIANLPVPPLYIGPLQGLSPGPIRIGPNSGYVWMRVTLSPDPVLNAPFWDGTGYFDMGETEDYLLRIDDGLSGELGDAPENVVAYPSGVVGQFPTCILAGPAGYVYHAQTQVHFGPGADTEGEGNQNQCPQPPYDLDECFLDPDAGLLFPRSYTLDAVGTVKRCENSPVASYWVGCQRVVWGVDVDIHVENPSSQDCLVNVLVDWDEDGRWGGTASCPNGNANDEHVLVDFPVPAGFSGPLSQLGPPSFVAARDAGFSWCRFTISDAAVGAGWDGSGSFHVGETEDYLLAVLSSATSVDLPDARPAALHIDAVRPNPFNPRTTIAFSLAQAVTATLTIHDAAGRRVRTLVDGALGAGAHAAAWDGRDDQGLAVASGVYIARLAAEGRQQQAKLVLLK